MRKSRKDTAVEHPEEVRRPAPLSRIVRVDEIKDGEELTFEASATERAAMAELLQLVALDRLNLVCTLQKRGEGRLLLAGTLAAAVTQTCVVSLEPVATTIDIPVEIEFWPSPAVKELIRAADETATHGVTEWPEPIIDGKIDLGPVLYETLSTSLDPYPRREGVTFEWQENGLAEPVEGKPESPFAALAALKRG